MSYLFLDFDGVMHPARCQVDMFFCHQHLLESWLRTRSSIDVVISSSWREVNSMDEMRSFFADDLQQRIVGATPILKRDAREQHDGELSPTYYERETEITRWLSSCGQPWRSWAALDDQPWLFKPLNPKLVLCDGQVGLTQRELDRLDSLLCLGS